jgi:SPP1 gp7 family putative phage head morphogenesis protein
MMVNYFELAANFELAPAEALAFFQAKGLKPTFAWQDMLGDEHDQAFTVAKMMDTDLLATVKGKLDDALAEGATLADFKKTLIPQLQKAGWWGKADVIDPLTGNIVNARLGSASRLETIFRTNLQSAYAAGQWQAIEANKDDAPYLLYDAVDDHRTRREHATMDGTLLPVGHPWWDSHAPSNGWNCRCGVIQLDDDELADYGLKPRQPPPHKLVPWKNPRTGVIHKVPSNLDPGWDHNPGKARASQLATVAAEKAAKLAKAEQAALKIAQAQQAKALKAAQAQLIADEKAAAAGALKAEQGVAQATIDQHIANKTPFVANAIKSISKTQAGAQLNATELLQQALAKAPLIEQSANLSGFKATSIKGKTPSAKQQAAFDALPDEAQASMIADIEAKNGVAAAKAAAEALAAIDAAAEQAATDQLKLIATGQATLQPGIKKKLFEKWSKDGTAASYATHGELLKAITDQATLQQAKAEKSSVLSGYKKKILAGKVPTAKQKAVFDAMSEPEQAAFLAKLDAKKSDKESPEPSPAVASGLTEPVTKSNGNKSLSAAKPDKTPDKPVTSNPADDYDDDDLDPEELENMIDNIVGDSPYLIQLVGKLQGEKAGNITLSQKAHYHALEPEQQALIDDWVAMTGDSKTIGKLKTLKKDAKVTSNPDDPLPFLSDLTQIGPQKGSNPGGLYQDITTGTKWYIKQPDTPEQARNEVLTGKLYESAGIDVADMHWRDDGPDGMRIYSKIIDGLDKDAKALKAGEVSGAQEHFIVDAWLGNWDVVGLEYDNLLVKQGRAIRIDTGAGLLYRAQGEPKGGAWNNLVGEIDSLRDPDLNAQAHSVFKHTTEDQMIAGARKVLSVKPESIKALVNAYGPADPADKAALIDTLLARQKALAKRFPAAVAKPKAAKAAATGQVIAPSVSEEIADSRINGRALLWDKDDIEDHNVRFTYARDPEGNPVTRVSLQLSAATTDRVHKKLKPSIAKSAGEPDIAYEGENIAEQIKEAVIGINSQAKQGKVLRQKDIDRVEAVIDKGKAQLKTLYEITQGPHAKQAKQAQAAMDYLDHWRNLLYNATAGKRPGNPATSVGAEIFQAAKLPATITMPVAKAAAGTWSATRKTVRYNTGTIDRSHLTLTDNDTTLPGAKNYRLRRQDADTLVDFYPPGNNPTMRGKVYIEAPGHGDAAGIRVQAIVQDMGVNIEKTTKADREELYLDQMAYSHTAKGTRRKQREPYDKITGTQAQRIGAKQQMISNWVGHNITTNKYYKDRNRDTLQAFGHGRQVMYRADFKPLEVDGFAKKHRLYHNPNGLSPSGTYGQGAWGRILPMINGGGQLISLADRLRRGLSPGDSSPDADFNGGGANYVFARIQQSASGDTPHTGIFFKAERLARRVDAVSYPSDKYGNITDSTQRSYRAGTVGELRDNAQGSHNEMIFKDGLSLFEDLDVIVLYDKAERDQAIKDLKAIGYNKWPDGRVLTKVIKYSGQ